jgi:hypothetical protein
MPPFGRARTVELAMQTPNEKEEKMFIRRRNRILKRLVLSLALATIVVPAAQAVPGDVPPRGGETSFAAGYSDVEALRLGGGDDTGIVTSTILAYRDAHPAVSGDATGILAYRDAHPDVSSKPSGGLAYRDARPDVSLEPTSTPIQVSDRFDWSDAGIGAALAFAAMLLAAGAALGIQRGARLAGS